LWVAAIDFAGNKRDWSKKNSQSHITFSTAAFAAVFLAFVYAVVFYLRFAMKEGNQFGRSELAIAIAWSAASHLLVFTILFVLLKLIRLVSNQFSAAIKVEFVLCN